MIEAAFSGFIQVFAFPGFFVMLLGMVIGLSIGIIPGLGGQVTLALLLPTIYGMDPPTALAFLLGAHAVVPTGGSITAILFNVPGTGQNVTTTLDGFPMTKQGKGGKALGAALGASAIGGVIGAVFLMAIIPVMRPLAFALSAPEFFMLALLGISFISSIGGGDILKNFIAGGLGLMITFIGLDSGTGVPRYTFGQLYLWEGIKLIPAVIGLFAFAEMLALGVKGGSLVEAQVERMPRLKDVISGVGDVFRNFWLTIQTALMGTLIGAVPGMGGDVANVFCYGYASQRSKHPETFGQGNIEGIIGPEAANNAKEGGSLIPTLGFAVPGSAAMAILLGAFYMLGLQPGPVMLKDNLDLVFFLAWIVAIANLIGGVITVFFSSWLARASYIRGSLLVPLIMVLGMLGAFSATSHIGDLIVAFVFALLGYGMMHFGYSRVTLLLGLVLGQVAEKNLTISLNAYGYSFWIRPISLVLLAIIIAGIAIPILRKFYRKGDQPA